jgi:hypothetical protein
VISDLGGTVAGMVTTGRGGGHVNRGRDTPSFCPTLQVLDMLLSAVSVLVVELPSSEFPDGLMNYPAFYPSYISIYLSTTHSYTTNIVSNTTQSLSSTSFV